MLHLSSSCSSVLNALMGLVKAADRGFSQCLIPIPGTGTSTSSVEVSALGTPSINGALHRDGDYLLGPPGL